MISSGAGAISASMMCSNLVDLSEAISIFERNKIEYLHIDVMDGDFVPNYGLGVDYIRGLRELTKIPLDIHLMVNNPEYKLGYLDLKNTDIVSIHYESTRQLQRAIDNTKKYGCKCFLAINPSTPINVLEEVLDYIDGINMLMVNPGFAGQKNSAQHNQKNRQARGVFGRKRKAEYQDRSGRQYNIRLCANVKSQRRVDIRRGYVEHI